MSRFCILLVLLFKIIYGCSKDVEFPDVKQFPHVITLHPSNINTAGALLRGEISGGAWEGKDTITYGFIISIQGQQSTLSRDTIILGETTEALRYDHYISNHQVLDSDVYIYAFARDDNYLFLGDRERVIFSGDIFEIKGFYPEAGVWQDTILIFGKRLSGHPDDTRVLFRQNANPSVLSAGIIALSADTLMVTVPAVRFAEKSEIVVEIAGLPIVAEELFYNSPPVIEGFYPEEGYDGDTIMIFGKHLGYATDEPLNWVSLSTRINNPLTILEWTSTRIIAILDDVGFRTNSKIQVTFNGRRGESDDLFYHISPWYEISEPAYGRCSYPTAFSRNGHGYYGGCIHSPFNTNYRYYRYIPATDSWSQAFDLPFNSIYVNSFVVENRPFIVAGHYPNFPNSGKVVEYVTPNQFPEKDTFPYENLKYFGRLSLETGDRAFLLAGTDEWGIGTNFFEYDVHNDAWIEMPPHPISDLTEAFGFNLGDQLYVGTGKTQDNPINDFFSFDLNSNTWIQLNPFPKAVYGGSAFVVNGQAYAGLGTESNLSHNDLNRYLYAYDPHNDSWEKAARLPVRYYKRPRTRNCAVFVIDDRAYIGHCMSHHNLVDHNGGFAQFDSEFLQIRQ
ncbi:MAG: hypothetical protein EA393_01975 [Bacteroidetes bacterium]|nr:MAG: hypothetical protein EA393_01975 [Bacteroidota bacterium]